MNEFDIQANEYLHRNIRVFYHVTYVGMGESGNPDYINDLKNTYGNFLESKLRSAAEELESVLLEDLAQILQLSELEIMTVCVVPRAKAENSYHENQLLFQSTVRASVSQIKGFEDGTSYISRHTNTRTTHLRNTTPNYDNGGPIPYPGITAGTCDISVNVIDQNILLVDDIYTTDVNIDEDAIQALINAGANSVTLYVVGKTETEG
jgi:hypothetical protein